MTVTNEIVDLRMNLLMEVCRRENVKVTHQRMEIFRELAVTDEHPDAETIYERVKARIPTVSLDTIYRALSLLEKLNLVSRVRTLSERTRFDGNCEPHHHFVCSNCGLIKDFNSPEVDRLQIPVEVRSWGRVNVVHVELEGICSACMGGNESELGSISEQL